jgi:urease accessory protein
LNTHRPHPGPPAHAGEGGEGVGAATIDFALREGQTRLAHLYQHQPLRVLFPAAEAGEPMLAAIATVSGGLVGGDRIRIEVRVGVGAAAHVTAAAAEKVYRSLGRSVEARIGLSVMEGGWLEYLPPATILFEGARLFRETAIGLAAGAGFLGGGITVFGRRARGERFTRGFLRDVLEVSRGGRLVWGDALHLDRDIGGIIEDPACLAGAAATATLILAPPDGKGGAYLEDARRVQQAAGLPSGLTSLNGLVIARWLADDPARLRRAYADLACHLRAAAMGLAPRLPRLWHA